MFWLSDDNMFGSVVTCFGSVMTICLALWCFVWLSDDNMFDSVVFCVAQ